ncbi:MAG: protein phosphatase 2C domain-containing protein, partial [Pseudomonadota bacterium]
MGASDSEWEVSALSETGHVRERNEDCMTAVCLSWGQIFIVADGMGGHKGGALAADLTVRGLVKHLCRVLPGMPIMEAIRYAFERTNKIVYKKAHSGDSETKGMGSTVVVLLILGSSAFVAHVGDSRAYLYRKGHLRRLTKDHSAVQRMIDAGMLSAKEARD